MHNDGAKIALLGTCRNVKKIQMIAADGHASGHFGEHDGEPVELCRIELIGHSGADLEVGAWGGATYEAW